MSGRNLAAAQADSRNSLFKFLHQLHSEGVHHARVDMLLVNAVQNDGQTPDTAPWPANMDIPRSPSTPTEAALPPPVISLTFSPPAVVKVELPQICGNIFENLEYTPAGSSLWFDEAAATGTLNTFFERYVRVLPQLPSSLDMVTTNTGIPIVSLRATTYSWSNGVGQVLVARKTLDPAQERLKTLVTGMAA
jgi:hypothetical protein